MGITTRAGRAATALPAACLVFAALAGCQTPVEPVPTGYVFTMKDTLHDPPSYTPYVVDSFSCSGIGPAQLETVLAPGNYTVDTAHCAIFNKQISFAFLPWGVPEVFSAYPPFNMTFYEPYWFYQFPAEVGFGGVWWRANTSYEQITASPSPDSMVVAGLEVYHLVQDGYVYSRGLLVFLGGDWQNPALLKTDPVSAVTQLAFLAAQGLKAEYPDLFPNPLPAANPSPYVPPEGGVWPTSTTTAKPTGDNQQAPDGDVWAPSWFTPTPEPTPTTTR